MIRVTASSSLQALSAASVEDISNNAKKKILCTVKNDELSGRVPMEIYVQEMVGGNVIITFGRVDVELKKEQAEKLKALLVNVLERSERTMLLKK